MAFHPLTGIFGAGVLIVIFRLENKKIYMKKYVVGFAFTRDGKMIALIEKQKPDWQKGNFNGIGGKIEETDFEPIDAMYREFKEETGVSVHWHPFAIMKGKDWICYCYKAFDNEISKCRTIESEKVEVMAVDTALNVKPIISNLKWLINLALDENAPSFVNVEY